MNSYLLQRYLDQNRSLYWLAKGILAILFLHSIFLQPANAQEANLDLLCQRSPLNSRCQEHQTSQQDTETDHKPISPKVIKFKLNDLGGVSEWIRVEMTGNQVKLLHTVVAQSGLSRAITSVAKLPIAIDHTWYDHPTSRIVFQPDGCENSDCLITGTNSITLTTDTDIYQGQFTLQYTESGWLRTITFRIPH